MRVALLTAALGLALTGCSPGTEDDPVIKLPTDAPASSAGPSTHGPTTGPAVPGGAFLKAGDLGGQWRTVAPLTTPCPPTYARSAVGNVGLSEARGTLTETIATEVDVEAAVAAWRRSLQSCGFTVKDDALGDAGVSATSPEGSDRLLVTGTEGVLIVVHAHGKLAESAEELESWADLAFGTACVAHPDGCHGTPRDP